MIKIVNNKGKYIRYISYFFVFISIVFARLGKNYFSDFSLFFACLLVSAGYFLDVIYIRKKHIESIPLYTPKYIAQSFMCVLGLFIWFMIALFSSYTNKSDIILIIVQILSLTISFLFWVVCFFKEKNSIKLSVKKVLIENIYSLPVIALAACLGVHSFAWEAYYDELTYITSAKTLMNYNFSIRNEWLILCDHFSICSNFFIMPGLLISKGKLIGIRVVIFALALLMSWCTYLICRFFLKEHSAWLSLLASCLLILFPTTVGTMNLNVDYFSLLILPIVIAAYLYNYKLLFWVFSMGLCFTKETTAILYLGFALGAIISDYIRLENRCSIFRYVKNCFGTIFYYMSPVAVWGFSYVAVYFSPKPTIWGYFVTEEGELVDAYFGHFGTDLNNIKVLFAQFLLDNGIWVPISVCIILFLVCCFKKKKLYIEIVNYLPVLFSILGSMFINCIYTTYYNYRYKSLVAYMIILVSVIISIDIVIMLSNRYLNIIALTLFVFLGVFFYFEQEYIIDPVTRYVESKIGYIFPSPEDINHYEGKGKQFNYLNLRSTNPINRSFYERPLLLEKVLNGINYDENTLIVLGGDFYKYSISYDLGYFSPTEIYYYPEDKKMVMDENAVYNGQKKLIPFAICLDLSNDLRIYNDSDVGDWKEKYNRVIYIDYFHNIQYDIDDFAQSYGFSNKQFLFSVSQFSWKADVYEMHF